MDDETLSVNLSILSKLEISEKLDTKKSLFQIHGSSIIPEFILRFIMGSSRHSDFARIRSLYAQAIAHIDDPRMADLIEASLKGLRNLRITYQEDTTLLSRIDCLIQQVVDKLKSVRLKIQPPRSPPAHLHLLPLKVDTTSPQSSASSKDDA